MDNQLFTHVHEINTLPQAEREGCGDLLKTVDTFLNGFRWAKGTGRIWVAECIPGVIGLFLVELRPSGEDIDPFVWVVVGDLPPAYLSPVYAKTPKEALEGYIGEMDAWIEAVQAGKLTDELIPVNGAPTQANAEALKSRLQFLESKILPDMPG
jgi:hypothetical protein